MESMDMNSIWTVLITAITVLGSTSAWKFYERKIELKKDEDNFIKQDCRDRIAKLEVLLKESSQEKEKMRETCQERYGVDNIMDVPEVKAKMAQTMMDRYGVEHYNKLPEMRQYLR